MIHSGEQRGREKPCSLHRQWEVFPEGLKLLFLEKTRWQNLSGDQPIVEPDRRRGFSATAKSDFT